MKRLWCWRCQGEMPMLDEEEFAEVSAVFHDCKMAVKEHRTAANVPVGESRLHDLFAPAREKWKAITGHEETNHNAIWHHRVSIYGPPCEQCGKVLRTPMSSKCWECGADRPAGPWSSLRTAPLDNEALPDFDFALAQVSEFVAARHEITGVPLWAFRGDIIPTPPNGVLVRRSAEGNVEVARRIYGTIQQCDGGLAINCVGKVGSRPVYRIEHSDDPEVRARLMLPSRGLKISVLDRLPELTPVKPGIKFWWHARNAQRRGILFDEAVLGRRAMSYRFEGKVVERAGPIARIEDDQGNEVRARIHGAAELEREATDSRKVKFRRELVRRTCPGVVSCQEGDALVLYLDRKPGAPAPRTSPVTVLVWVLLVIVFWVIYLWVRP